jgi:hypothetical protein
MWDPSVCANPVLNLHFFEVVDLSDALLNGRRMAHPDQARLYVHCLEVCVEQIEYFLELFKLQVHCTLLV